MATIIQHRYCKVLNVELKFYDTRNCVYVCVVPDQHEQRKRVRWWFNWLQLLTSQRVDFFLFISLSLPTHFIISLLLTGEPLNEPTVVNKRNMRMFDWSSIRVQDANVCVQRFEFPRLGLRESWLKRHAPWTEYCFASNAIENMFQRFRYTYLFASLFLPQHYICESAMWSWETCIFSTIIFASFLYLHMVIVVIVIWSQFHTMDIGHTKQVWRKKTTRRMLTIETRNVWKS